MLRLQTTKTRATWYGVLLGGGAALLVGSQQYPWPLSTEQTVTVIIATLAGSVFWGLLARWIFGRAPRR